MRWNSAQELNEAQFRRLTGVKRAVFRIMVEVLSRQRQLSRKRNSGRKPLLCIEDQLLLLLGYYREYRTQLALAADFGLSESRCSTLLREVESLLLKDQRFHLQGKKALLVHSDGTADGPEMDDTVIIDVSESPVERPKKSSVVTIRARRSATPSKLSWSYEVV